MLLIYTSNITPRLDYAFKHICTRILGVEIAFTSVIEMFISHQGPKMSYGKHPMGNEFFVQSQGLITQQGFEDIEITVKPWDETFCFFSAGDQSVLPFDIFSAAFYMLSRYEEYLPHVKDVYGRFPSSESLAVKHNFIKQPVVDVWAYKFKEKLSSRFPDMVFKETKTIIHHLIEASRPFEFSQRGWVRNAIGYGSDISKLKLKRILQRTKVLLRLKSDPYDTFEYLIDIWKKNQVSFSFFFMMGNGFTFREEFNNRRKKIKSLIKYTADYVQVGLIFSFHSLKKYDQLKKEKESIEALTHRPVTHAFTDKFVIDLPNNYRDLVALEILKDFSMLYEDTIGFRAGTCTPFLFYDLDYEIKTPLIIHPLAGKIATLSYQNEEEVCEKIDSVIANVKRVNGTFSLFFSNKDFSHETRGALWQKILLKK